MRYPEFLPEGGTVAFTAPSFGAVTEPYRSSFKAALALFEKMGYRTRVGSCVYAADGTGISSTPERCGRELTELYCDPANDILLSAGGGELMCEILDFVDFERIRAAKPRWFTGYSDNTNFGFLLATLCDTASLYAACAPSFGTKPLDASLEDALDLLRGRKSCFTGYLLWEKEALRDEEHPLLPYHLTEPSEVKVFGWDGTPLKGRLLGGCMDVLGILLGTSYDAVKAFNRRYREDGVLWFLEACDLNVFSIRRTLWQMKHAGWFEEARGFLIGRPLCMGQEMMGLDQYGAVLSVLEELKVPILTDMDIGHLPPMLPMVNGALATVTPAGKTVKVCYDFR